MSKKRKGGGLSAAIIIVITLLLCGLLYYKTIQLDKERDAIVDETATIKNKTEIAKIERQNIENEIKYRETDDYIEDQAREIFGLRDPDDTIFVPQDSKDSKDSTEGED